MENNEKGLYALAVFRIMIGWLFIWGFLDKFFGLGFKTPPGQGVINGVSPSSFEIYVSSGIFKGLFDAIAGNAFVDFMLMAGLLILGITISFGIATKLTTLFSVIFFIVMFCLCVPPSDNPLINYHVILAVGMLVIFWLGGYSKLSMNGRVKELAIVKRYPILE